jgi:hypothetical protein
MSKSKNKDDSAPTEPLSARLRWWPIALSIGVVVFLGCLLGYRTVFSPDIGYHMATGRLFYEMGQFALEDTFSYSFAGQAIRYMPWLFGLVCYLVYHAGGTPALVGAKIVVTLISAGLLWWRCRRAQGRTSWFYAAWLLVFFLGCYWEVRPHLGSWLFLNLVLFCLEEYERGSRRIVWFLPLIQLLWVNCHSLYILGIVCIGAYGLADLMRRRKLDFHLLKVGCCAWLACLVSPYGLEAFLYPITQFGMLQPESVVQSEVAGTAEFMSPFRWEPFVMHGELVWFQERLFRIGYFAASLLLVAIRWKSLSLFQWILLASFAFVFFRADKLFGYYVMVTLPLLFNSVRKFRVA